MSVQARRSRTGEGHRIGAAANGDLGMDIAGDGDVARRGAQTLTLEMTLYLGALLVGVILRMLLLDLRPLSVQEGALALESHRLWQGERPDALHQGPLSAYGTALLLGMFAGTDGAARLLSVLFGSLLVVAPYLLRENLGRVPALLAAYGLAISPLVLFASRSVGSGVVAVALGLLLWWALDCDLKGISRWRALGVALLLAGLLASGPEGITVGLALGAAALLSHPQPVALLVALREASAAPLWRRAAVVFVAALLVLGTGFATNLAGIQWAVVGLWAGWVANLTLSAPRAEIPGLLALYEFPVLLLGLAQLVRTVWQRQRTDTFLSLWALMMLLLGMLDGSGALSRVVMPAVPLYLLSARLVSDSLGAARGAQWNWRWAAASTATLVPLMVLGALLTRASTPGIDAAANSFKLQLPLISAVGLQVEQWALVSGLALVLAAAIIARWLLDGQALKTLAWYAGAALLMGFLLHSTLFLNYREDSLPTELVTSAQVSPFLRDAAKDAGYFSAHYAARVTVDPQWRSATEWYLREARDVQYSTEVSPGISFQSVPPNQTKPEAGAERRPGLYLPSIDPRELTWQGLWRWLVFRDGLVRPNQRDIIARAPVGNW